MNIKQDQISLLLKEAHIASSSIRYGLNALCRANIYAKGDYYQAFFQLSIGLERLMKLIIIENYRGTNNSFPNNKVLKDYGHDLIEMFERINEIELFRHSDADMNDISFSILKCLSQFAKTTRYYNLDALTGKQQNIDPLIQWAIIQEEILRHNPKRKTSRDNGIQELKSYINENSVAMIFNEKNNIIDNTADFIDRVEMDAYVQEYAVYYTYLLISELVNKLLKIESNFELYPYLSEFFRGFYGGRTKYEIRKRRNWTNY